ncbi:hypothetical protein CYMTET_7601 [Cymbomonas tetramitiformis]|uniref:Uncharacterized protein n=1 Tax=Cymbomonas tetramitiformis TaxID=36881 RepID=A0AAE0FWA2_9CHLO|nr:hypothetical protein CYMTET_24592 [Cymbomonas tetramitiformis]KAK3284765.1 hypothetical protein CYMTET_7601 [Cymbomonas tetramitiformis]
MECMSLDETAKLKEEALKEEENLKKAAQAKELAAVAADIESLVDQSGSAEQPPATGTDSGQTEAPVTDAPPEGVAEEEEEEGEDTPGDREPLVPIGDAPTE